jgi:hypothetical protein
VAQDHRSAGAYWVEAAELGKQCYIHGWCLDCDGRWLAATMQPGKVKEVIEQFEERVRRAGGAQRASADADACPAQLPSGAGARTGQPLSSAADGHRSEQDLLDYGSDGIDGPEGDEGSSSAGDIVDDMPDPSDKRTVEAFLGEVRAARELSQARLEVAAGAQPDMEPDSSESDEEGASDEVGDAVPPVLTWLLRPRISRRTARIGCRRASRDRSAEPEEEPEEESESSPNKQVASPDPHPPSLGGGNVQSPAPAANVQPSPGRHSSAPVGGTAAAIVRPAPAGSPRPLLVARLQLMRSPVPAGNPLVARLQPMPRQAPASKPRPQQVAVTQWLDRPVGRVNPLCQDPRSPRPRTSVPLQLMSHCRNALQPNRAFLATCM